MRRKIAWGPEDVKGLFIEDKKENLIVNAIRETINDELIHACEEGYDLVFLCKKRSRTTHVEIQKKGVYVPFNHGVRTCDDSNPPTKDFEKAISDFKKKWGKMLIKEETEQGTQYFFLMF